MHQISTGTEDHAPAERRVPEAPRGLRRAAWLGPGFLWMVSAAGSGELLFTPRIGALYGYALLWALLAAIAMKWFINREVGRWAVCTGTSIVEGLRRLPGPRGWALYLILVPQLAVAVATIAGLGSGAATAVVLLLPGGIPVWTVALVALSALIVFVGGYRVVERVGVVLGVALALAAVATALSVLAAPGSRSTPRRRPSAR